MPTHFLLLILPITISSILHMVAVKKDWLPFLKIPISVQLFGANKTLRGFVFLPVVNGFFFTLANSITHTYTTAYAFLAGFAIGFACMLFELPNSFIKRRLGIASGQKPEKRAWLFALADKCDSAIGVGLTYYLLSNIQVIEGFILLATGIGLHIFFSWLLVKLKIKRSF